jgi:hypothetical protein
LNIRTLLFNILNDWLKGSPPKSQNPQWLHKSSLARFLHLLKCLAGM